MMGGMDIRPGLPVDDETLAQFCRRHAIRRLAVFGSALRNDFRDDSDIDVLVDFATGATPGLLRIAQMELELAELIDGREVEIRTYEDLSRYFRDDVAQSATTLYAAA
jgi:predicted nucleotidyltransferase